MWSLVIDNDHQQCSTCAVLQFCVVLSKSRPGLKTATAVPETQAA